MKKHIRAIQILFSVLFLTSLAAPAQTSIRPFLMLQYFKDSRDSILLKATLTYSDDSGQEKPLRDMKIGFLAGTGSRVPLAEVFTNDRGVASFVVKDKAKLPSDSEGLWSFSSEFAGNDTVDMASAETTAKDIELEMILSEADSVKTVSLNAFTIVNGKKTPVAGETITISVLRMFSLLPIAEVTFDENGSASAEFPNDLPGDQEGNITVTARFADHPSFGNVEKSITQKWGIPTHFSIPATHRALWTKTAPMWMIITLSVLLTGVWGHYMFAVISLILIKLDANRKKDTEEYRL